MAKCGQCSNCLDDREAIDITVDVQKVLSCVIRMNQRFGKNLVAQVLTGSNVARVKQLHFDELSTYGIMKQASQKSVAELIDFLTAAGYLFADGGQYPVLRVTELGGEVLHGNQQVFRKVAIRATKALPVNSELFEALRSLRREFAEKQQVPPFVIFSDKTLRDMCSVMPVDEDEMLTVKGIGANKMAKYGTAFLQVIDLFRDEAES